MLVVSATAKLFVEESVSVFITGRSQERLKKAVKEIDKNVTGVQGDAGNLAYLDRQFETVKKEKGRIDVLFASAVFYTNSLCQYITKNAQLNGYIYRSLLQKNGT